MDMKEELIHAYEIIELQKQHLSGQRQNNMVINPPFSDLEDSSSDSAAKFQEKFVQMEQDRAYEVLELQRRLTEMSEMYKSTIDHWKRETNCWRDRFESSWEDHERTIRQLQEEKNQLEERAQKAEQDLAAFRGGADETLLELVRAKARVHDLEEQLSLEVENCDPNEAVAEIAKQIPTGIAKAPPVAIRKNAPIETKAEEASVSNGDNTATENTRHEHKGLQASFIEDAMKRAGTRSGIMGRFSAPWGLQS
jgi:DNA repair ATPase RecN